MGGLLSRQQPAPKFDPATDLPDLSGKVMIVTGGSSGIGFATVQHLARRGAKVYIATRSEARGRDAVARLHAQGLETVAWHALDLGDPRAAKKSAEEFAKREARLDVLVNNAGLLSASDKIGADGVLEPMMVNHFGPVIFTRTLLPLLKRTAQEEDSDVRVVMVSSSSVELLNGKDIRYRDINDFNELFGTGLINGQIRYAKSKLANALYAKELQKKLDAEGSPITVVALHPGAVYTEGLEAYPALSNPIIHPIVMFFLKLTFKSPSEGAYCSTFAAASPIVKMEKDKYKGAFLYPPCKIQAMPPAEDRKRAEELWNATEALLKQWDI